MAIDLQSGAVNKSGLGSRCALRIGGSAGYAAPGMVSPQGQKVAEEDLRAWTSTRPGLTPYMLSAPFSPPRLFLLSARLPAGSVCPSFPFLLLQVGQCSSSVATFACGDFLRRRLCCYSFNSSAGALSRCAQATAVFSRFPLPGKQNLTSFSRAPSVAVLFASTTTTTIFGWSVDLPGSTRLLHQHSRASTCPACWTCSF